MSTLTLGRRRTDPEITQAIPSSTVCGFRMADIVYADGDARYAPMMIVFVHPDELPAEPTLFEAVDWS